MNKLLPLSVGIMLLSCQSQKKKTEASDPDKTAKPNIVYILADDLGYGDLSCYGQTKFAQLKTLSPGLPMAQFLILLPEKTKVF